MRKPTGAWRAGTAASPMALSSPWQPPSLVGPGGPQADDARIVASHYDENVSSNDGRLGPRNERPPHRIMTTASETKACLPPLPHPERALWRLPDTPTGKPDASPRQAPGRPEASPEPRAATRTGVAETDEPARPTNANLRGGGDRSFVEERVDVTGGQEAQAAGAMERYKQGMRSRSQP